MSQRTINIATFIFISQRIYLGAMFIWITPEQAPVIIISFST